MTTKKCLECGDMFCKPPSNSKKYWKTRKYCSYRCSLVHTTIKKQSNSDKPCLGKSAWNSGVTYTPEQKSKMDLSGLNLGRVKGIKRPNLQGDRNPLWKERVKKYCEICKTTMYLQPWESDRRFCNRACWALGTRGKGSPVYKGDKAVARLRNRIAQMPEYREWHASVMKRDGYKCTVCYNIHSKSHPLEVDHIKRFLFIANEYKILTPEDSRKCKELWDVNNGRVICRPCHRTTDTYGTKGLKNYKT